MRNLLVAVTTSVVCIALTSCGGGGATVPPQPPPPSQPSVTLSFLPSEIRTTGSGTALITVYVKKASDGTPVKQSSIAFSSQDAGLEIGSPQAITDNSGRAFTLVRAPNSAFHDFIVRASVGSTSISIPVHTGPSLIEIVPNAVVNGIAGVGQDDTSYSCGTVISRFDSNGNLMSNFDEIGPYLSAPPRIYSCVVGRDQSVFVNANEFGVVLSADGHHVRTLPYDIFTGEVHNQQLSQIAPDGSIWFHYNGSLFSLYPNAGQSFGVGGGPSSPLQLFKFNSKGNVVAIKGLDGSPFTIDEITTSGTSVRSGPLSAVTPRALQIDGSDRIYVFDTGVLPYRVVLLDQNFEPLGEVPLEGGSHPDSFAVDSAGKLVFNPTKDSGWNAFDAPRQVFRLQDGEYLLVYKDAFLTVRVGQMPASKIQVPTSGGWTASATTMTSGKELYSLFPDSIEVMSISGDHLRSIPLPMHLNYPSDIDRDVYDSKYVLDGEHGQILIFDAFDWFVTAVQLQDFNPATFNHLQVFKDGSGFVVTNGNEFAVYGLDGQKRWGDTDLLSVSGSSQPCLAADSLKRVHTIKSLYGADGSKANGYTSSCPFYFDGTRLYLWDGSLQVMAIE